MTANPAAGLYPDPERGDGASAGQGDGVDDEGVVAGQHDTTAEGPATASASSPEEGVGRSVVVPVYGEPVGTVGTLVDGLLAAAWDQVVVCVDEPDGRLRDRLSPAETPGLTLSTSEERRGKGGAIAAGLAASEGSVVGYVDADGAVSVADLDRLYRVVESGVADMAVGSRDVAGGQRAGQGPLRRVLGRGYGHLARVVVDAPVRDLQCGAKAFSREVWTEVGEDLRERGFAFDTELVVRADRVDASICEVGIDWADPGGSSVSPLRDGPAMFRALWRVRRDLDHATDRATTGSQTVDSTTTGGPSADSTTAGSQTADSTTTGSQTVDSTTEPREVALVTAHPPEKGNLAEYGARLARAYADRPDVSLTVLAPRSPGEPGRHHPYGVERVWERDSLTGALGLLHELRTGGYDAAHFNVHVTYFGEDNAYRFLGLLLPSLARLVTRRPVLTTLHDMLDVVAERAVGEDVGPVERLGAKLGTQAVLLSDATTVTAEAYRDAIREGYLARNVHHVPHGTFEGTEPVPEAGSATRTAANGGTGADDDRFRVMVFGHLGPTKDVETVVEAVRQVHETDGSVELVVAGDDHPQQPGYRERLETRFGDLPFVRFTGYVPEAELDEVWGAASLLVVPYRTCTGVSGVFQLAKQYGTPAVVFDAEGMRDATVETGGAASFVPVGETDALAEEIARLRADDEARRRLATENAAAAGAWTMSDVAAAFVEVIEGVSR